MAGTEPTQGEIPAGASRPARRRVLALLVTSVSVLAVCVLWADAWPGVRAHLAAGDPVDVFMALLLSVASIWLVFLGYVTLVRGALHAELPLRHLAHLYFAAQLMKHLPGRIWGIGYQAVAGDRVARPSDWVAASVLHLAAAIAVVVWAAFVALSWHASPWLSIGLVILGSCLVPLAWRCVSSPVLAGVLSRVERMPWIGSIPVVLTGIGIGGWLRVAGWLLAGTALTYLAWIHIGSLGGVGNAGDAFRLSAFYILAWLVGYLSVVTPSGLGVRELAFAWLASGFPPETVATTAILSRLILLAADIALGVVFAPLGRATEVR